MRDEQAQHDERDRRAYVEPFQPRGDQAPQHEASGDNRERTGIEAVFHYEPGLLACHRDLPEPIGPLWVRSAVGRYRARV